MYPQILKIESGPTFFTAPELFAVMGSLRLFYFVLIFWVLVLGHY